RGLDSIRPQTDGVSPPLARGAVALDSTNVHTPPPPLSGSRVAGDWLTGAPAQPSARELLQAALAEHLPGKEPRTWAPDGASLKPIRGPDVSFIGLPNSSFDPTASYAV